MQRENKPQRQSKNCTCHNFPVVRGSIDKIWKCGVSGVPVDKTGKPYPQTRLYIEIKFD